MFAFSFIAGGLPPVAGGLPPAPPVAGGVRSAPLRFAACSPHVRRMVAACSPHGRRMVAAWSPHVRRMFAACSPHVHRMFAACSPHRQDSALYNFCSICYNSDKERKREREKLNKTTQQLSVFIWQEFLSLYCSRNVVVCSPHRQDSALYNFCSICYNSDKERKREREKLNKTTQQLSVFIWHEFLSLYCSRNVVVCSPHRQAGALYNFCSICYNSDKERKSEREKERKSERAKERNLASHRDRLQGQAPRTPVAGGNPHAHLNGTVEHPGLPAPSQEASPPHPPSNRRGFPLPNTLASRNGTVARLNGTMRHTGLPAPSLH